MSLLEYAAIAALLLLAVAILTRRIWWRCCPACDFRHLRHVTSIHSAGATPESKGAFIFYRCETCGETLQRHNGGPITVASHWRSFIIDNDLSNPTRPSS